MNNHLTGSGVKLHVLDSIK